MWFIGVEVEQETRAPPPKKNHGSAPVTRSVKLTMISQISSHEFSGSFWETPSGEKQHKSGKSAWREGLCSGTKRPCGGKRRVSSPGPVFVEDKAKKR